MATLFAFGLALALVAPPSAGGLAAAMPEHAPRPGAQELTALEDGESWWYGREEQMVLAERRGELVTVAIRRPGEEASAPLLTCVVGRHRCSVHVEELAESARVVLTRSGDEEQRSVALAVYDDRVETIGGMRGVRLQGSLAASEDAGGSAAVAGEAVFEAGPRGEVVLACPEGDVIQRVRPQEEDLEAYCERHGLRLEPLGGAAAQRID